MNSLVVRFLLIALFAGSLFGAEEPAPVELVIGTWREGSNLTEPRPAQSKYFKTTLGAFQIIQGFAGYKWFIEVTKHPEKRIYTRTIVENPQDPKKPFVYEHFIDPDTPRTVLTHGPAIGLKLYRDYTVEFVAYSDAKREKEIDRLTQKIRSYVDTTGPKLKLFSELKTKVTDSLQEHASPTSDAKR